LCKLFYISNLLKKSSNIIKFSYRGFVNILTQKLGFKKSSLSRVYAPRFQPVGDLVKTGIQKVEFKLSLCTQISPSWWPWSSKVELKSSLSGVLKSKFSPWLGKSGIQKVEFTSSFSPRFHPACDLVKTGINPVGDWSSKEELKSSWSGVLKSKFSPWLDKNRDSKIWV